MPRGKRGPKPDDLKESPESQAPLDDQTNGVVEQRSEPPKQTFFCGLCAFTGTFEEWNEHSSATSHDSHTIVEVTGTAPEQTALFETQGVVKRFLNVAVSENWLNEARLNMQRVVRSIIEIEDEKKEFDADCNERLKPLKEQLRGLDSALHRDTEQREVECEWRLSTETNSRILVRMDTGETIETKALTEEDFRQMQDAANAQNAAEVNAAREASQSAW